MGMKILSTLLLQLLVASVLWTGTNGASVTLCTTSKVDPQCNANEYQWVKIESVDPVPDCFATTGLAVPACDDSQIAQISMVVTQRCANVSQCTLRRSEIESRCAAKIVFECIQGARTTPRTVNTPPEEADAWKTNYASWQWAIIWIVIAVVLVAFIILVVMLVNKCCYKALNEEKPNFIETSPTQSNVGSTLNSRSVSMSTLHRPPIRKEVSQEEIDEVRAQFGTNKKKDKNMKHYGVGIGSTLDSRRSSGDGESGEPNGRLYPGDDSSSGIGSVTYESRLKHGLYDDTDTCHDDYVTYTMKKQAKSPLVNPNAYGTLQSAKKVDEDLYKKEAPTVDISEDRREENFRLDINSWTLNKHGQQVPRADPTGASTVKVDIEHASSDIQLNPGEIWMLHDHQRIKTIKGPHQHKYRRLSSIIKNGSENLGYIPEYGTLPSEHTTKPTNYDVNPNKPLSRSQSLQSAINTDNLREGSESLQLDLSDLDLSLSTDQFSFRKPLPSRKFYEKFGTPRSNSHASQSSSDRLENSFISVISTEDEVSPQLSHVHNNLSYSYPNISLTTNDESDSSSHRNVPHRSLSTNRHKYTKSHNSHHEPSALFSRSLPLPMNYGPDVDLWRTNERVKDVPASKMRSGDSRISYLTQIKLGETVRLQQEATGKKKRKRINYKGTVHYSVKSNMNGRSDIRS